MTRTAPRLTQALLQNPGRLLLRWTDGFTCTLHLPDMPMALQADLEDDGYTMVLRPGDQEYSAPELYKLAAWQENKAQKPADFREARQKLNMTQEHLAAILDISRRTIGYYEDGTLLVPKVVTMAMKQLATECAAA